LKIWLNSYEKLINDAFANKIPHLKYTFRCKTSEGNYLWREDIMNMQYDENGNSPRIIVITRDITKEKNVELEKNIKQKEIDLQNKLLT
jgi:PAS domain S-box-containing protein